MQKTYRPLEETVELVEALNLDFEADEDGWYCKAVDCDNGLAYIEIYDEEDEFLGYI